jgi:hypothetical protein
MESLPADRVAILWQVASRIVPESGSLDAAGRFEFERIVDAALADRPAGVRRQFGVFLKVIRLAPVLRYGRPFDRLPGDRQDAVLRWVQDGPVPLFRSGFWGLKAIVFMGYYGRPGVWREIGYAPEFDSLERLGARA